MSWVKERLEELGFADVAARLDQMTQPHRERPRKQSAEQLAEQLAKRAAPPRHKRRRPKAQESA